MHYNNNMDKYFKAKEIINNSSSIIVFSGAGISTSSGIPDFRSEKGIFSSKGFEVSPEQIVSHTYFYQNPSEFYRFYKEKMVYLNAKPSFAHSYFASLDNDKRRVIVITQNIDSLHTKAGNKIVYELHGSIYRNYCIKCHKSFTAEYVKSSKDVPLCDRCGSIIKPDVVLYEEPLDSLLIDSVISEMETSDTLIVLGTSLRVYPASSFLHYFRGNNIIVINKESIDYERNATLVFNEDIDTVIKKIKDA